MGKPETAHGGKGQAEDYGLNLTNFPYHRKPMVYGAQRCARGRCAPLPRRCPPNHAITQLDHAGMVADPHFEAWYQGMVVDADEHRVHITFPGWESQGYNSWMPKNSDRYRRSLLQTPALCLLDRTQVTAVPITLALQVRLLHRRQGQVEADKRHQGSMGAHLALLGAQGRSGKPSCQPHPMPAWPATRLLRGLANAWRAGRAGRA